MANYRVLIKKSAGKELERLHKRDLSKIIERIRGLAENPRPEGCKKLSGEEKYRIRQGDYRILYQIQDEIITITAVRIRHRKDVYR